MGRVKLGHLKNIKVLKAMVPAKSIDETWYLAPNSEQLTFPSSLDAVENETIEFPFLSDKVNYKNLSFLRYNKGVVLEDLLDGVKFEKVENSLYNKIKLCNLAIGEYKLFFKKENLIINLTVHSG